MEQSCLWRYLRSGSVACFSKSQAGRVASELLRFWPNFQAQTLATELLIKKKCVPYGKLNIKSWIDASTLSKGNGTFKSFIWY